MNTRSTIIKKIKKTFPYLSKNYGVKRIGIFGSYSRNMQNKDSDIDLIVEFNKPIGLEFIDFSEYLEKTLGHKVDILTPDGITNIKRKKVVKNIKESLIYV
jgi:predicted nucleotidyltransferase